MKIAKKKNAGRGGRAYPLLCPDTANYLLRDCISKSRHRRSSLAVSCSSCPVARHPMVARGSPTTHVRTDVLGVLILHSVLLLA